MVLLVGSSWLAATIEEMKKTRIDRWKDWEDLGAIARTALLPMGSVLSRESGNPAMTHPLQIKNLRAVCGVLFGLGAGRGYDKAPGFPPENRFGSYETT